MVDNYPKHRYKVQCLLDNVGDDPGEQSEVKTYGTIYSRLGGSIKPGRPGRGVGPPPDGSKTQSFSGGPYNLPVNQKLVPPKTLLRFEGDVTGSDGYISVYMEEVDSWTNADDRIISLRIPAPQLSKVAPTKTFEFPFGFGRRFSTEETGFEGKVVVKVERIGDVTYPYSD